MHSEVPIDPKKRDRATKLITELATKSRAEPGVINYRVTTDIEDPNTLRIFEQYVDKEAAEAHESSNHLEKFLNEFEDCLSAESELRIFHVDSVETAVGP